MANKEIKFLRAEPGEIFSDYITQLQGLRNAGIEVMGEFWGVEFNNMDESSVLEAFNKAQRRHEEEIKKNYEKEQEEKLDKRKKQLDEVISKLPEDAKDLSLDDILEIVKVIHYLAIDGSSKIRLSNDMCDKLLKFFGSVGFTPVSDEMKFVNVGSISLTTYAPPAPEGRKNFDIYSQRCAITIPEEIDLEDLEQLKSYAFGNLMAQLKTGNLDIANLGLFEVIELKMKDPSLGFGNGKH